MPSYFKELPTRPQVHLLTESTVPNYWRRCFNARNEIFGLEMLDTLAFISISREKLRNSSLNLHIDNNNVLTSLVRGASWTDIIGAIISLCLRISEAYAIDIWLGRVSSKRNPVDLPTRHAPSPSEFVREWGLVTFLNFYS